MNSRTYRMDKRAEQVNQTRQRIVEATVELHGTVGPALTTIAGIAELAGVTRLTVYRHFPDEEALYGACSTHWAKGQQLPEPDRWLEHVDPSVRLRAGLADLYRFYRSAEPMLTRTRRDKEAMPLSQRQEIDASDAAYVDTLLPAYKVKGVRRRKIKAAIGHAVSFWTWRSLCVEHKLTDREAIELMVGMVSAEARA